MDDLSVVVTDKPLISEHTGLVPRGRDHLTGKCFKVGQLAGLNGQFDTPRTFSSGSRHHAPSGFLLLIWPANNRAAMGSYAPCPVGTVGATNRTVVPITVMARIWLANSYSPVGADTSSPIDSIDTGGCVAWLGQHERAKSHHDGKHRCATRIEAQYSAFH
jgi:hypothetical protein